MTEDDTELYNAWRESEAYQVPVTQDGITRAEQRFSGFIKGWKAHKKSMEQFMDIGCIERGCPCFDPRESK